MSAPTLPLAVAVPLLAAAALMPVRRPVVRRAVLFGVLSALSIYYAALVAAVADGSVLATAVGGWPGGVAITFAVDAFSALMLSATALATLLCAAFAAASGDDDRRWFAPLVLILTAGVAGALSTSDVFNLFVFLEVSLVPSYVLIMMSDDRRRRTAARVYITASLLASTLFVSGVALAYGTAGTTNLAALVPAEVRAAGAVLLTALAVKAALAPMHGWLAQSYPYASPAVAAMFSVLHTKVGLYAIYRVYTLMLDGDPAFGPVAVAVCALTMAVGAVAALGPGELRPILSFSMVSTNGYIALGAALSAPVGLAAGIFYLLNDVAVKGALFLSAGAVEHRHRTGRLAGLGGLARREPVVALAFLVPALSLAGMPPFSGFVAKFALVRAAMSEGRHFAAGVAVAASLLTLAAMVKIWQRAFVADPERARAPVAPVGFGLAAPALILGAVTVVLGPGGEWLLALCDVAGRGLADPTGYVEAVLGP
ncbi:proton-conducting transporter transmembrane domain-containing protein [Glycomyces xiaoerkulensis]|uniref:proton-conducting transporter transmembrane domain-containing protein n=1 Tax=Glycomyces xiaoerkulensis TaxID=2038139 RepID=UPI000C26B9D1|nr:proton-conducting transporter membrane subunit [Glycomyces xiaoerkulensis]